MKLRTVLAATCLGLSVLACGRGGQADLVVEAVAPTEPWVGVGLPLDGGTVVLSTSRALSIVHEGQGSVDEVAARYLEHARANGWEEAHRRREGGTITASLIAADHSIGLSVMESMGAVNVSMVWSPLQ